VALSLLPFQVVYRLLARFRQSQGIRSNQTTPGKDEIVWAVAAASPYVPAATCLTQALATWIILIKHGEEAHLQIGVAKNQAGKLEAHAWVESGGRVLIGDSRELFRYTLLPLPSLDERLS
jgi:hypothetical protein